MFTPDNAPMIYKEKQLCAKCGEVPPHGWCLFFPELEGQPLICSRCMFKKLAGFIAEWRMP